MKLWAPSQSVPWHDTGPPAGQTHPGVGGVGSRGDAGRGVQKHSEHKRDRKQKKEEVGEGLAMAMLGKSFRLHGNPKEKAPLKSSSEARHGLPRTGPQRFLCPGKDLLVPACDLESRVRQQSSSSWKGTLSPIYTL